MCSYLNLIFSGGDCAEDINDHGRPILKQLKGFDPPSADTIIRMQKELSTEKMYYTSHEGILYEFNSNPSLNPLILAVLVNPEQIRTRDATSLIKAFLTHYLSRILIGTRMIIR